MTKAMVEKRDTSLTAPTQYTGKAIELIVAGLKEGVDYGLIPGTKKRTLWRAGALKLCFGFGLQVIFTADTEVISMLASIKNVVAFKCTLVDRRTREVVGEGRGAAVVGGKPSTKDPNGAIKMAQKSAEIDAAIRTFALYDRFVQEADLEPGEGKTKLAVDEQGNISL